MRVPTAATTGKTRTRITLVVTLMASAMPLVRRMIGMSKWNCSNCSHVGQETTDDVASCNCCDNGEFYDPVEEEVEDRYTLDDLGPCWW